uniref:Uncharacterized protein n=1 Tax=Oryza brachyantha TaxID=4533 RepID=J3LHD3_ORYBR
AARDREGQWSASASTRHGPSSCSGLAFQIFFLDWLSSFSTLRPDTHDCIIISFGDQKTIGINGWEYTVLVYIGSVWQNFSS